MMRISKNWLARCVAAFLSKEPYGRFVDKTDSETSEASVGVRGPHVANSTMGACYVHGLTTRRIISYEFIMHNNSMLPEIIKKVSDLRYKPNHTTFHLIRYRQVIDI